MHRKIRGIAAGVLVGAMITGAVVLAKQTTQNADLYYNDIKIYIDGAELSPKDVNGNPTEPFTMNGSTYLPVRAIASALGKEVEWDGDTQSVYIGKKDQTKPDTYLDKLQYNDYREGTSSDSMTIINGKITDFNGNAYKSGLLFYMEADRIGSDDDRPNSIVYYPLNSQYRTLTGNVVLPKSYDLTTGKGSCKVFESEVWFYGDDKLLYKATGVTSSMPFHFDIDVSGVNQLVIKIHTQHEYVFDDGYVALTDLALYKKSSNNDHATD